MSATTQREMRRMLSRRWREKDLRGVWFWGSWLLIRWHVPTTIGAVVGMGAGVWIVGILR